MNRKICVIAVDDGVDIFVAFVGEPGQKQSDLSGEISTIAVIKKDTANIQCIELDEEEWKEIRDNQIKIRQHLKKYFDGTEDGIVTKLIDDNEDKSIELGELGEFDE